MFFVEDSEHFATERERAKRGAHIANLRYLAIVELLIAVVLVLPYMLVRSLVREIRRER